MPNRVALLRAEIEAAHPGAVLWHRGEAGFSMLSVDRRWEYHKYTTGPWHWRQPADLDWREIDTDLEARPDPVWKRGVRSAGFDTLVADDGRRRFVPRRWVPDEWVEFGALQWQALSTWSTVSLGVASITVATKNVVEYDRPTHAYRIGVNGRGCRTELTLKTALVARPIRWPVTLTGLTLKDGVLVSAKDGKPVGFIRPPSWSDSSEHPQSKPIPWKYEAGHITLTPDFAGAVFPVTVDPDYSITAGADDGYIYGDPPAFYPSGIYLAIGSHNSQLHSWLRFQAIAATKGQDCTAATLAVVAVYNDSGTPVNSTFYGIAVDDHTAPTSYSSGAPDWVTDHANHTQASVAWNAIGAWTLGTSYVSPDLSVILDALFARDGWQTGNDIGIHWDSTTTGASRYRSPASFENSTKTEPILSLTLAAGGQPQNLTGAATSASTSASGTIGLKLAKKPVGATTSASSLSASLKLAHKPTGAAITASSTTAALTSQQAHSCTGAATSASTSAGSLKITHELSGAVASTSTSTGSIHKHVDLMPPLRAGPLITADDGDTWDNGIDPDNLSGYFLVGGPGEGIGPYHAWIRVLPAMPAGATVGSATLTLKGYLAGLPTLLVYAADADDQTNPTTWAEYGAIPTTDASLVWEPTTTGIYSLDVTTLVAEVAARPGWSATSHLVFLIKDNGSAEDTWVAIYAFGAEDPAHLPAKFAARLIQTIGTSSTAATLTTGRQLDGAVASASTTAATLKLAHKLVGAAASASSTVGDTQATISLPASGATSVSTTAAVSHLTKKATGAVVSASAASGVLTSVTGAIEHELAGSVTSASTTAAVLIVQRRLTGGAVSASSTAATIIVSRALTGAATSTSSVAGSVTVTKPLAGTVTAASTTAGVLTALVYGAYTGAATSTSTTIGDLKIGHKFAGALTSASSTVSDIKVGHPLTGAAISASSITADLEVIREAEGTVVSLSSVTAGNLKLSRGITGAVASASSTIAALTTQIVSEIEGAAIATSTVAAALTIGRNLYGTVLSASTSTADTLIGRRLLGALTCISSAAGNLVLQTPGPHSASHTLTLAGDATLGETEAGGAALTESSDSVTLTLTGG